MCVKTRSTSDILKEGCTRAVAEIILAPTTALKILGVFVSVIVIVVWLSIILGKHRKARVLAAARSKHTVRRRK